MIDHQLKIIIIKVRDQLEITIIDQESKVIK